MKGFGAARSGFSLQLYSEERAKEDHYCQSIITVQCKILFLMIGLVVWNPNKYSPTHTYVAIYIIDFRFGFASLTLDLFVLILHQRVFSIY